MFLFISHVYLACNPEYFTRLTESKCAKYIKTLREVNIAFLPYERQVIKICFVFLVLKTNVNIKLSQKVFTLDSPDTFYITYNPMPPPNRTAHLDGIAEQIATLCATLGEYPTIRYRG